MQAEVAPPPPQEAQADAAIDALQVAMTQFPAAECPVTHRFTPGLYIREIFMPADSIITSKIHRTEHPFVVSKGAALVWIDGQGWQLIQAPYTGITKPGTRRVLIILADTVWTTFHPTTETDVAEIERQIIEPRYEHLEGLKQPTMAEFLAAHPLPEKLQ